MNFSFRSFVLSSFVFTILLLNTVLADEDVVDMTIDNTTVVTDGQTTGDEKMEAPTAFSFSQCGENPKQLPIQIKKFSIKPDPVIQPGILKFKLSLKVKEEIQGPIKASVRIEKHTVADGWHSVPCVQDYGSCDYQDICPKLKSSAQLCPKEIKEKGLNCHCPLQPGKYSFKTMTVPLQMVILDGSIHFVLKFTSEDDRLLACLESTVVFQLAENLDVEKYNDHS